MPLGCPPGHTGKMALVLEEAQDWRTGFPETNVHRVLRLNTLLPPAEETHAGAHLGGGLPHAGDHGSSPQ